MKTQCKCGAILNAKEELAGKQAKCPKCGDTILIPKPSSMRLTCSCGQVVQAKASLAGKRVKCPTCSQPIDVPSANGALGSGVLNAAKTNNTPSIGAPFPQLPATPATGFNNSVWDDLAKAAEKAESASKATPYQHTSKTVAKRSGVNRQSNSLSSVRLGITFVYVGLLLIVAAIIATVLALLFKAPLLIIGALILTTASSLLSTIGRILCLTVPKQVGAKDLIYLAVAFDIMALLLSFSPMIPGMQDLRGLSGPLGVIGIVLFVFFLRKLANYIDASELAHRAWEVLILWAILGVLSIFVVLLIFLGTILGPMLAIFGSIFGLIAFPLSMVACFRYFQLLSDLRLSLF
jgi:DNA-directed RNA polymerase subunit RPC12/RpoP